MLISSINGQNLMSDTISIHDKAKNQNQRGQDIISIQIIYLVTLSPFKFLTN